MSALAVFEASETDSLQKPSTLWWRIGLLLVLVMTSVLVLISFLNFSNYRKTFSDLTHSRYSALGKDLRQSVEAGLNIGLRPSANMRLGPMINELLHSDKNIRYIGILDEHEIAVSDGAIPKQADIKWNGQLDKISKDATWTIMNVDVVELGMPFTNNFGIKSGAIIIAYDRRETESNMGEMLPRLGMDMLLTLVILAVAVMGGVYLLTRGFAQTLESIAAAIDSMAEPPAGNAVEANLLDGDVVADVREFSRHTALVAEQLAHAERDVLSAQASAGCGGEVQ